LLQMDGLLTLKEWDKVAKMGIEGCKQVYEIQKAALQDKFKLGEVPKSDIAKKVDKKVKKKVKK